MFSALQVRFLPSRFRIASLLATGLIAFSFVYPGGISAAASDAAEVAALFEEMNGLRTHAAKLDTKACDVADRIAKKEALIEELIAGRLTLRDVTDRFFAMSQHDEAFIYTIRHRFPGKTDEERTAYNVMDYAEHRVEGTGERHSVMERLNRERHEMCPPEK